MMSADSSAQLVTTFDPGAVPMAPTSVDQALAEWSALGEQARAEALLILIEAESSRPRVLGRSAITALAATR